MAIVYHNKWMNGDIEGDTGEKKLSNETFQLKNKFKNENRVRFY